MELPRIIFVDDEACFRESTEISLDQIFGDNRTFAVEYHEQPLLALESIKQNPFNVCLVFLDHHFRKSGNITILGADFIKPIKSLNPYTEVIMMSADQTAETLRSWLKNGADKFLYKEFATQSEKLQIFISEALTKFRSKFAVMLEEQGQQLSLVPEQLRKIGLVSVSSSMRAVADTVLQAAPSELSVLILGETGTGKELIARAIHDNSRRNQKEFRTIDCTQFKRSELIASELFGSEKGAFTGAESKIGLFEIANGGTVFLDEVHHLGEQAQAMLLRFLQDRKVRRVGGKTEKTVDVRLVFAGKPCLRDLVQEEKFLVDLLFRMKEVKIDLPALKERPEDIEVLCEFFSKKYMTQSLSGTPKKFHPDVFHFLKSYPWPGNVRELENFVRRLIVFVESPLILLDHVTKFGELETELNPLAFGEAQESFTEMSKRHEKEMIGLILKMYQNSNYNLSETARKLGVARSSLRSQCQALGIWQSMDVASRKDLAKSQGELKRMLDQSMRFMGSVLDN